jgi:hypothetical protein
MGKYREQEEIIAGGLRLQGAAKDLTFWKLFSYL